MYNFHGNGLTSLYRFLFLQTDDRRRQMIIRKLRRYLLALENGHKVKVRQILAQPVTVGELRRSLPSDFKAPPKQNDVTREVAKEPDVSRQSDYEYINLKVETLEVDKKESVAKGEDVPPPIPPRPTVMIRPTTVTESSRKSAMRMFEAQNHVATPKQLLRMFAERFNNRRRSTSPLKRPRVPHQPVKRTQPSIYSRISSPGCASMMISGSGLVCTSTSCQLSSANCTRTMLYPSGGGITDGVKRNACTDDEKVMSAPSGEQLDNSEFICLAELSSINHVTNTMQQECSVCLGQPLQYPQSSTPTVPVQPHGTPEDNVLLSGILITPCVDQPSRTPEKPVKRAMSETFIVKPAKDTPEGGSSVDCAPVIDNDFDNNNNDRSKPVPFHDSGLTNAPRKLQEQRQTSGDLRLPCLGAESRKRSPSEKDAVALDAVSSDNRDKTLDSDATAFMQDALCHKPVTYKMKISRRSKVKGQLKGLGRQIRELGANKLNLPTLAVL